MIAFLRGTLESRTAQSVVLEVNGVGYEVTVPASAGIGSIGAEVLLHTHLHLREDGLSLYGFRTLEEKELFLSLLTVSGVGPKLAMGMLSAISPTELKLAISRGDLGRLTALPGVGKKTAQRLVLELKDKIAVESADFPGEDESPDMNEGGVDEEAIDAMVALGFSTAEARRAVGRAIRAVAGQDDPPKLDNILRAALQNVAEKR